MFISKVYSSIISRNSLRKTNAHPSPYSPNPHAGFRVLRFQTLRTHLSHRLLLLQFFASLHQIDLPCRFTHHCRHFPWHFPFTSVPFPQLSRLFFPCWSRFPTNLLELPQCRMYHNTTFSVSQWFDKNFCTFSTFSGDGCGIVRPHEYR